MNLAEFGLNLDTDDLKQAGNLGLWKAVPKFDTAHGMKFLTYAAPAIRNAMMDMVQDAFNAFEQRMVTEDKDGIHDLLIAGLTVANAVKVAARVLADGHSLNGKGSIHIAEVALVLGRGSILDTHG